MNIKNPVPPEMLEALRELYAVAVQAARDLGATPEEIAEMAMNAPSRESVAGAARSHEKNPASSAPDKSQAPAQPVDEHIRRLLFDARGAMLRYGTAYKTGNDDGIRESTASACALLDQLAALATSQQAPAGVPTSIEKGFRFDSAAQHHVPTLLVEFEPVPVGEPNDSKGWKDRNALAAALASALPVAWRTFDGEGGYEYRTYEGNEDYIYQYVKRNGGKYAQWVQPVYAAPAAALARIAHLEALMGEAHGWLHAAYGRPPQTPEAKNMLALIEAAMPKPKEQP